MKVGASEGGTSSLNSVALSATGLEELSSLLGISSGHGHLCDLCNAL